MLRRFCPLIRYYSGHLPEKKGLCSFILSALSRLTYLLLHRFLLSTFLLTPYFLLLLSLLLLTSLLTTPHFSPYSFPPYHLLLTTSLLTPSPLFLQTYPPAIAAVGRWLAVRCLAQWHRRPCATDSLRGDYPYNRALERCEEFRRSWPPCPCLQARQSGLRPTLRPKP